MDLKKIQEETAQLLAEARKQLELKKSAGAGFDSDAFEKRIMKALADDKAARAAEARKAPYSPDEAVNTMQPRQLLEKSDRPEVKEFQKFNDDVVLLSALTKKHPTQLDYFQKNADRFREGFGSSEIQKAMNAANSGSGQDWVPTQFSTDLYDRVRLEAVVGAAFAEIQMPSNPYKLPTADVDPTTYLTPENTSDPTPTQYPTSTPSTGNVVLTASKLTTNILFSDELVEDSIIPILEFIKNKLAKSMTYTLEDAYLNGDTTATHMDADVTASNDARKSWKGLRRLALVSKDVSFSTWAPALNTPATGIGLIRKVRAAMGKYGTIPSKLGIFVGPKGLIQLLGMPEIMTLEKYGPAATIMTGELAKVDGVSVLVSEKMREDVNASGFNDSTTNVLATLLMAYLPGFVRGTRRGLQVRPWIDPRSGTQNLVQDWRGDFEPVYNATTQPIVVKGINWAV